MSAWRVKTRRAPPRHCREAGVHGRTTTAMHDNEYTPLPPPLVWCVTASAQPRAKIGWKRDRHKPGAGVSKGRGMKPGADANKGRDGGTRHTGG